MKKQIKLNWQTITFTAIVSLVFMFAGISSASAQTENYKPGDKIEVESKGSWYKAEIIEARDGQYKIHYKDYGDIYDEWLKPNRMRRTNNQNDTENYKVGDRVENMSAGKWVKAEILEVKDNGNYVIRFIESGISGAWVKSDTLRPIKADAQTNNQTNADNQVQNQTNGNTQATNGGGTASARQNQSIGGKYRMRDPRICADTKAPAKGAISAALATKYFMCQGEQESSDLLYLVENVNIEVGGGIPYSAIMGQYSLDQIDVKHPVYPIRGNYTSY